MDNAPVVQKTRIAAAGHQVAQINARFSPQILALFSDHLYSSANKAFEELVTNSWDADATSVYVHLPDDLSVNEAALYILDNGRSMDVAGLQQLWTIAESNKRASQAEGARKRIGKFGIGKLATYILCNELTYICKAADGVVRVVTMDYREIDEAKEKHLNQLPLAVRELKSLDEIKAVLLGYSGGQNVFDLISAGVPPIKSKNSSGNEYGGKDTIPAAPGNTWTLAILTSLKDKGKALQRGWIRRLLSTALPLGNSMGIQVNKNPIESSKLEMGVIKSWIIGSDLGFDSIEGDGVKIMIEKKDAPYPHVVIPGVGEVTGTVTFFAGNISGGKSDSLETSNGFFVNVLGRVVNYEDNQFKLPQLNHGVFSRMRVAIRVDGLDGKISISRESISEGTELTKVRAFLHEIFNMVRREEASVAEKKYVQLGQVRKDEISRLPITALSAILHKSISDDLPLPGFVKVRDIQYIDEYIKKWDEETKEGNIHGIEDIEFRNDDPQSEISSYDLVERKLVINEKHPFVKANSETKEQKELLRDFFTADLLADAFLMNSGIPADIYQDYFWHRDQSRRLVAQIRRPSASIIMQTLAEWQDKAKPYEEIVGDALEFLGLEIKRLAASGEPEGIATAYVTPAIEDKKGAYSFTFDAKSTKNTKVQTGNVHIAGLARHRDAYKANYALVVAPDFQDGALAIEAKSNRVTPMTGDSLAKLIAISVGFGPISLQKLEEVFGLFDPQEVEKWVLELEVEMSEKLAVNLQTLISAVKLLVTPDKLDRLSFSGIAQKYRELIGHSSKPSTTEIARIFQGLSMLMPTAIGVSGNDFVVIYTHPDKLEWEIKRQLSVVPDTYKIGSVAMAKSA